MINILLAEDNQDEIILIEEAIVESNLRIELSVVRNGAEAMKYLRKEGRFELASTPDVLILDLNMPKKTGSEVILEIRADDTLKSLPIILMSTSNTTEFDFQGRKKGEFCFVAKPSDYFEFKTLIQSIEKYWFKFNRIPDNCVELMQIM